MRELPKAYDPKLVERKNYALWEKSGFFNPDKLPKPQKKPFTILMPPPNANGTLHIGHAVFVTLQDIMIRFKRMQGFKTLWLPGADHAGFETQVVYNKKLEKEGRQFWHIPREKLYQEILAFTLANKKYMEDQLKLLGASCDWSREKFTLDPAIKTIVYETFKKLYDDGLIYRENRLVNWCAKHQTTLSDLEVKWIEKTDKLYTVNYGPLNVATVRPETMFGDIAVAVHPKGKWKTFIGQNAIIPIINKKIPIIADESVDKNFGTGAVKVTPSVDFNDFEMAKRHNLPRIEIVDRFGKLTNAAPENYRGKNVQEARILVEQELSQKGFLQEIKPDYKHAIAVCYKCDRTLEPHLLPQWYVAMTKAPKSGKQSLRDMAISAVKTGKITFVTKQFEKVFMHWMKNIKDWNISRQIVWGIRIPAWYHEPKCIPRQGHEKDVVKCKDIKISQTKPRCAFCDAEYVQETDVFDTWFSSGQWPFATLRASPHEKDFRMFYPTQVMETGYDILFFWVARMIMLGLYCTGKVPFKIVYLHGLVRDKDRQKMSKSKGNVIDPLGVAEIYGTDALRIALTIGNMPGQDIIISEDKIRGYRNFINKVWNIARFILLNTKGFKASAKYHLSTGDKKILKGCEEMAKKITQLLEKFQFSHAGETLYHYIWHTFADRILEQSKPVLLSRKTRTSRQYVLLEVFVTCLKLLHPFCPFVTEELYQKLLLKNKQKTLLIEKWPLP